MAIWHAVEGDVCVQADLTVTFFRKKPAHVLDAWPRLYCGEVVVADIGIPDSGAATSIRPRLFENGPAIVGRGVSLARAARAQICARPCVVVSGPAHATGAARLAARGALRVGAGLVSVASPPDAVAVNAAALTAIMVKPFAGAEVSTSCCKDKRLNAVVIGPGCGVGRATRELVAAALASSAAVGDRCRRSDLLRGRSECAVPAAARARGADAA